MGVKFPFEAVGKSFFGEVFRPVAKVSLHSIKDNVWVDTWMVIDTGADFTILPLHLSEKLRISLEDDCIKDSSVGIGGEQTIYLCKKKVKIKIDSLSREIPLAFFDSNEIPPILGRLGALETFETTFNKNRAVIFKN